MLCKVTHCAGHISTNTRPHHWGDWEMGTAISCTKCSQVTGFNQNVGRRSSEGSSLHVASRILKISEIVSTTHKNVSLLKIAIFGDNGWMNDNIVEYDYDCKKLFYFLSVLWLPVWQVACHMYIRKFFQIPFRHYVFTPHRATCLYITNQCPVLSG